MTEHSATEGDAGLVERLRGPWGDLSDADYKEAAARIEALEAALQRIVENEDQYSMAWAAETARAALAFPSHTSNEE